MLPSKKPSDDDLFAYRNWVMNEVEKLMNSDPDIHILDALHTLGIPRALFLANIHHPSIRKWWDMSSERALVHAPGELPDIATIRSRSVQAITQAGLDEKLAMMAASADPFSYEGQQMILDLANLRAKMLPKTIETKQVESVSDKEAREELERIREERRLLMEQQEKANEANFDLSDDE